MFVISVFCLQPVPDLIASATPHISFVQVNSAVPQSPQTSVSLSYKRAQSAGDLNVIVVGWNDSTARVSSVSDSIGNSYVLAVGPTVVSGTLSQSIYYAKNITAAAAGANTVTVKFSTSALYPDIRILEYSGANPNVPVDVIAASVGSGTSSSSGAVATTNAIDLIFGANIVTSSTTGPGSGFASRVVTSPDGDIAEDRMVTATGSYSATAPITSGQWIMQLVAFRARTGSTATAPPPPTNTTYSISGIISGTGGDGATVDLSGASSATTTANSAGDYSFSNLVNGTYTVTPSKSGYTFSPASENVEISGTNITNLNFTATAIANNTYTISGTISGAGGNDATVKLSGASTATTTANSAGSYTFAGLANGNYTVTVSKAGYSFSPTSQAVTITGANATGLNFTATAVTYSISGTISPTAGGAGATVALSGPSTATTTTNGSGAYTFSSLANGSYALTPSSTGYTFTPSSQAVTISGSSLTGVNFTATAAHSVTLNWTASTSSGVSGYEVYRATTSGGPYTVLNSSLVSGTTYTDNNVQAGQTYYYVVTAVSSSGIDSADSNQASATIP